jgi:hypothetical protein
MNNFAMSRNLYNLLSGIRTVFERKGIVLEGSIPVGEVPGAKCGQHFEVILKRALPVGRGSPGYVGYKRTYIEC